MQAGTPPNTIVAPASHINYSTSAISCSKEVTTFYTLIVDQNKLCCHGKK